jgi:hypothetical protein
MHPLLNSCWVLFSFRLWNKMTWWISETFLEMTNLCSLVSKLVSVLTYMLCLVLDTDLSPLMLNEFLMIRECIINTRKGEKICSPAHINTQPILFANRCVLEIISP